MRFHRTAPTEHTATERIDRYELEVAPGHTVTRVDHTSRLGAGRKGRAAEVSLWRTLDCTCGAHLGYGGDSVACDLARLRHYSSPEERTRVEAEEAAKAAAIIAKLSRP